MYDVIVIGAGLGGLTSALTLAKEGKKVLVVEKHDKVGGYAHNFKRKDKDGNFYTFDSSLHSTGGLGTDGPLYTVLKDGLDVLKDIVPLKKKDKCTIIQSNGETMNIPNNFEQYKEVLTNKYPHEKENIIKLFDFLMELHLDRIKVAKKEGAPKYFGMLQSITLYDFLKQYVKDEDLIEDFSFLWVYYGAPPKKLSAFFYLVPWTSYHIGGSYYIKGGGGALSEALAKNLIQYGGEIVLKNEVIDVKVEGDKIVSISTKKGDTYTADTFILGCSPIHFFGLMDSNHPKVKEYKQNLDKIKLGMSVTQLYIGLDVKSFEIGIDKSEYFLHNVSHEDAFECVKNGDFNNSPYLLTSYDNMDKTLNPKDNVGVVTITVGDFVHNWPTYKTAEYKEKKKEVANILIDRIEKRFPGFKQHIKVVEVGTPHTMERYTNNTDGMVYGFDQCVGQSCFDRLPSETILSNTYLASAWTMPGGGYEGVIVSGFSTAERIIRDSKKANNTIEVSQSEEEIMGISAFMAGMIAGLNKNKAVGVDTIYHFNFSDEEGYFVGVKNCKANILKNYSGKADVVIEVDFRTWYDISFGNIAGEDALMSGKLKVTGDMDTFMRIPEMFSTSTEEKEIKKGDKKYNVGLFVNLGLVPWIIYWVFGTVLDHGLISAMAIIYLVVFMMVIKPIEYREITVLEGLGLFTFAVYGLGVTNPAFDIPHLPDILLVLGTLFSAIFNSPFTMEYSQMEYSQRMVKTRLFTEINKVISIMWAVLFAIKLWIEIILPSPINKVALILMIFGIIFSKWYPKHRLSV